MAVKAEVIFGLQLVTRHRAVRLAALLTGGIAAAGAASDPTSGHLARVMILTGGTLGSVAASRLLAPGPAFGAARMVVARWWLPSVGRLLGALCAVAPVTLGVGLLMLAAAHGTVPFPRIAGVALWYAVTVGSLVMALAPLVGASGAATLGFVSVWLGVAPSSAVAALFSGWPPLARLSYWAWELFPLPWRAARWLDLGGIGDLLWLAVWAMLGIGLAAWRLAGPRRHTMASAA